MNVFKKLTLLVAAATVSANVAIAQDIMPDDVAMTAQDRAYTSPIWYTP